MGRDKTAALSTNDAKKKAAEDAKRAAEEAAKAPEPKRKLNRIPTKVHVAKVDKVITSQEHKVLMVFFHLDQSVSLQDEQLKENGTPIGTPNSKSNGTLLTIPTSKYNGTLISTQNFQSECAPMGTAMVTAYSKFDDEPMDRPMCLQPEFLPPNGDIYSDLFQHEEIFDDD